MNLIPTQKKVIERIINVFETGTVGGDYGAISIYKDGPHKIRQITYGRSQTTEYGNLWRLVEQYAGDSLVVDPDRRELAFTPPQAR